MSKRKLILADGSTITPGVYVYDTSEPAGEDYPATKRATIILIEKSGSVFKVLGCNNYMGHVEKLDCSRLGIMLEVDYDP